MTTSRIVAPMAQQEVSWRERYENAIAEVEALQIELEHSPRSGATHHATEDRLELARKKALRAFQHWRQHGRY